MATVKFAPKNAPHIGNGRWTLPLMLLNNKAFINEIIKRGMELQDKIEKLQDEDIPRRRSNPQRLWEDFKEEIKEAAKDHTDKTHYKLASRIKAIEKDMNELAQHPNADTDIHIRTRENHLAHERAHLERKQAKGRKGTLSANIALHGEKMGGTWSAMSKVRKPRDYIRHLKIPNSDPPKYERNTKRMANLAKEYHDSLQRIELNRLDDYEERINLILDEIPRNQKLPEPERSNLNRPITELQTEQALRGTKNRTATGMDGCPYELWKALKTHYDSATRSNKPGFDIIKMLTNLYNDIQTHGVECGTSFSLGWMCPIYKKKDPTDISNYRPITLLNTDYKLLTKVLAIQLTDHIENLVHSDQAGFIPKRSIFDQIRLAKAIISYAEVTEENGAIVALDQEKAYDKIRHDYLWATLEAFNLPELFINTIKSLYRNARTLIAINGVFSDSFKVTRGIRQGDPISCGIFDLGIEPLACLIRNDVNLKGITIPGIEEPIKVNLFADDTNLYLSQSDRFDYAQAMLTDWCQVSGAKFNIEKTEIIPIGTQQHRQRVIDTRKVNPNDLIPLDQNIKIAEDGDAVRSLGAWIGNKVNDATPWELTIDKVHKSLEKWKKVNPSMKGRKIIAQAIIGGHTQFLTKAQGMPKHVEKALTKITRQFMWEDDSSPRIAMELLHKPMEEGGLNLIDIQARNEAIDIIWLKAYLNFSPTRPKWAIVVDMIIDEIAPPATNRIARVNAFLQSWTIPTRGQRANHLNGDIIRMVKVGTKHKLDLTAIRISPQLRAQLPAWYHRDSAPCPIRSNASKCLLERHSIKKVTDLLQVSARIHNPRPNQDHRPIQNCTCIECIEDRLRECRNPHGCAQEALTRIQRIAPKLNPLRDDRHGDLSLTARRKTRNETAKRTQGAIIFDPSITCKNDLSECFRIFTNPERATNIPAERLQPRGPNLTHQEIAIYTDGACFNNGKENAKCGSGIWISPNHEWNKAIRVPGEAQSNQIGEISAVITAATITPHSYPLK